MDNGEMSSSFLSTATSVPEKSPLDTPTVSPYFYHIPMLGVFLTSELTSELYPDNDLEVWEAVLKKHALEGIWNEATELGSSPSCEESLYLFYSSETTSKKEATLELVASGGEMYWFHESFLPIHKRRRNLEDMTENSSVKIKNLTLTSDSTFLNVKAKFLNTLSAAMYSLFSQTLFTDWLLLKCEATNFQFPSISTEVTIHSVPSIRGLKNCIETSSCLPFPLMAKLNRTFVYFYFQFMEKTKEKLLKLNDNLFFEGQHSASTSTDSNTESNIGIQLSDKYNPKIEDYVFYTKSEFRARLSQNEEHIRSLIFRHISWGFLQIWVRKLVKWSKSFKSHTTVKTVREVATHLLVSFEDESEYERLHKLSLKSQGIYLLGICEGNVVFLKYFVSRPGDGTVFQFAMQNIETDYVSDVPLIQYLRQFIYVNAIASATDFQNITLTPIPEKSLLDSRLFFVSPDSEQPVTPVSKEQEGKNGQNLK